MEFLRGSLLKRPGNIDCVRSWNARFCCMNIEFTYMMFRSLSFYIQQAHLFTSNLFFSNLHFDECHDLWLTGLKKRMSMASAYST